MVPSTLCRATVGLALGLTVLAAAAPAQAIEQPRYRVERVLEADSIEVRRYEPYIVAEVVVPGPAEQAGNQGFSYLGGYIFGRNKGERKIAMTAPVVQTPQPVKIAMTAPVAQMPAEGGQGFAVQKSGNSALWFEQRGVHSADSAEVWFDQTRLPGMAIKPNEGGSAEVPAQLLAKPGRYPVYLKLLPGGEKVEIGTFEVTP